MAVRFFGMGYDVECVTQGWGYVVPAYLVIPASEAAESWNDKNQSIL